MVVAKVVVMHAMSRSLRRRAKRADGLPCPLAKRHWVQKGWRIGWRRKDERKREKKKGCVCEAGRYYAIDEASAEQGEKRTINRNKNQMSSWWHLIVQSDSRGSGTQRKKRVIG